MSTAKLIKVTNEKKSLDYKTTALNIASNVLLNWTIEEQCSYIWNRMKKSHSEITWGCIILKNQIGQAWSEFSSMSYSTHTSQFLSFFIGDSLLCTLMALKSKKDEKRESELSAKL